MNLIVTSRKTLHGIPSASGIELLNGHTYIIGDDSPFLFRVNAKFEVEEKIPIVSSDQITSGKIAKQLKPDLEAMFAYKNQLFLFGSGSGPAPRDVLMVVEPDEKKVITHSLKNFYNGLCTDSGIPRTQLNIEGVLLMKNKIVLLNRGINKVIVFGLQELLDHIHHSGPLPHFVSNDVILPEIKNKKAGLSGACCLPGTDKIIFCATVEDTPNWIDDGEVLGSFVGVLTLPAGAGNCPAECVPVMDTNGNILKIKIESVAVKKTEGLQKAHLMLVTDNDKSESELLEAVLSVQ